jgi:hypothetical protein
MPASLLNLLTPTPQLDVQKLLNREPQGGRRDAMSEELRGMSFEEAQRTLTPDPSSAQPVEGSSPEPAAPSAVSASPLSAVAPMDQHRFDHERNWGFCGVATMAMAMEHHGIDAPTGSRAELNQLARGMYIPGKGTAGAGMATNMRRAGIDGAQFTTNGATSGIVEQLQAGGVVPMGITNIDGVVEQLPQASRNYPGLKVGDRQTRNFEDGHWVLVTGFEGKPEAPTAFLVNDPDTGARLRLTPSQLEKSAAANQSGGGIWMVGYGEQKQR